jgi:hypothetical protein
MKDWLELFYASPVETVVFLVSLIPPVFLTAKIGFQIHTQGPLILIALGAGFRLWMECLRHRQWLEQRHTGFVSGSQDLALLGTLGFGGGVLGAAIWLFVVR